MKLWQYFSSISPETAGFEEAFLEASTLYVFVDTSQKYELLRQALRQKDPLRYLINEKALDVKQEIEMFISLMSPEAQVLFKQAIEACEEYQSSLEALEYYSDHKVDE